MRWLVCSVLTETQFPFSARLFICPKMKFGAPTAYAGKDSGRVICSSIFLTQLYIVPISASGHYLNSYMA